MSLPPPDQPIRPVVDDTAIEDPAVDGTAADGTAAEARRLPAPIRRLFDALVPASVRLGIQSRIPLRRVANALMPASVRLRIQSRIPLRRVVNATAPAAVGLLVVVAVAGSSVAGRIVTQSVARTPAPTIAYPVIPDPTLPPQTSSAALTPTATPSASATRTRRPTPTASVAVTQTKPPPQEHVGTPAPPTTAPPEATPTPEPETLGDYLALIPDFPPAPSPVRVTFSHGPGTAALINRIPTNQPVAFITIDDGYWTLPLSRSLLQAAGIPAVAFLTTAAVAEGDGDVSYFSGLHNSGVPMENHTVNHRDMPDLSYEEQLGEICTGNDMIEDWFGERPTYFRPPQLLYNADTLRAAWDCGLKGVITARASVHDGVFSYPCCSYEIQPGEIIVLHFDPSFPEDFIVALQVIKENGLTPAFLLDYINIP